MYPTFIHSNRPSASLARYPLFDLRRIRDQCESGKLASKSSPVRVGRSQSLDANPSMCPATDRDQRTFHRSVGLTRRGWPGKSASPGRRGGQGQNCNESQMGDPLNFRQIISFRSPEGRSWKVRETPSTRKKGESKRQKRQGGVARGLGHW